MPQGAPDRHGTANRFPGSAGGRGLATADQAALPCTGRAEHTASSGRATSNRRQGPRGPTAPRLTSGRRAARLVPAAARAALRPPPAAATSRTGARCAGAAASALRRAGGSARRGQRACACALPPAQRRRGGGGGQGQQRSARPALRCSSGKPEQGVPGTRGSRGDAALAEGSASRPGDPAGRGCAAPRCILAVAAERRNRKHKPGRSQ